MGSAQSRIEEPLLTETPRLLIDNDTYSAKAVRLLGHVFERGHELPSLPLYAQMNVYSLKEHACALEYGGFSTLGAFPTYTLEGVADSDDTKEMLHLCSDRCMKVFRPNSISTITAFGAEPVDVVSHAILSSISLDVSCAVVSRCNNACYGVVLVRSHAIQRNTLAISWLGNIQAYKFYANSCGKCEYSLLNEPHIIFNDDDSSSGDMAWEDGQVSPTGGRDFSVTRDIRVNCDEKTYRITRHYPETMTVRIEEHKPFLLIVGSGLFWDKVPHSTVVTVLERTGIVSHLKGYGCLGSTERCAKVLTGCFERAYKELAVLFVGTNPNEECHIDHDDLAIGQLTMAWIEYEKDGETGNILKNVRESFTINGDHCNDDTQDNHSD